MSNTTERKDQSSVLLGTNRHLIERKNPVKIITPTPIDYRVLWIREKILTFFELGNVYQLFNELIKRTNSENEKKLMDFLTTDTYEEADLRYKTIFFYKTYREDVIQEEVSVWEEGQSQKTQIGSFSTQVKSHRTVKSTADDKPKSKNKSAKKTRGSKQQRKSSKDLTNFPKKSDSKNEEEPSALSSEVGDDLPVDDRDEIENEQEDEQGKEVDVKEEKQNEEEEEEEAIETEEERTDEIENSMKDELITHFLNTSQSSVIAPTNDFVPPPGEEENYILTRKVVDRVVQIPVLHCFFGEIEISDLELKDQQFFYIIRSNDAAVPSFSTLADCYAEMPRHVIVGSLYSDVLKSMNIMSKNVFKPLLENQVIIQRKYRHLIN